MPPRLTVVIPTHARETRLAFALDSLADQTVAAGSYEVIVVRSPASPLPHAEPPPEIDVTFLESPRKGPSAQRNFGWKAARSPLVAFMDDDCRVAPGWIERILAASEACEVGRAFVIQGRTEPDPDELHLLYGLARTVEITAGSGLYETCNIAYPVELLEALGGFDESFVYPWGEDTDLGLRAEDHGAELAWAGDAIAWHAVHADTLLRAIRGAERRRDHARLIARHPRLRQRMPARVFVNVAHRDVVFGVGCLLLMPLLTRRRAALAALAPAPYLFRTASEFARSERATGWRHMARFMGHLPSRALIDLAETFWTVRGAIDHRAPIA